MVTRYLIASLWVVLFGTSSVLFGADTEITLEDNTTASGFSVKDSSGNTIMRVAGDGNVGIGTTNPIHPLHMGSGAHVTAAGVWTNASSREYKDNIRDLTVNEAMAALDGLRPSRFNYKVDKDDEYVGFIAEDVPELVATKDRKGLAPMDITAVLTKVVQEQQRMLQDQRETIDVMKQEMGMMKSFMNYGVKGL
ncbi:MAG: tail fiber domain-containing protein [Candidatus Anammoxibacter sp.]